MFQALVRRYLNSGSAEDVAIHAVVDSISEFYTLIYEAPLYIPDSVSLRLEAVCLKFGINYQRLRDISRRTGRLWWPVRPKHHKFQHWPFFSRVLNPRFIQCYNEESLIGSVCKIWKRSISGRYRPHVQGTVLLKKLVGLMLRCEL
eukprot:7989598-Pyramimonas_sp.AAC.1